MQLAQDDARASESSERAFLSPGKAFALLLGVILLLGATIFLLRPDRPVEPTTTSNPPAPTFELTDAEAITRFEQLHELFRQGSMNRDASLIDVAMTSDSPLREVAQDDIEQLMDDRVIDESRFVTEEVRVVANNETEIVVLQKVRVYPVFVSERTGKDVTTTKPVLQTVRWTLHLEDGTWKVFDAVRTESVPLRAGA